MRKIVGVHPAPDSMHWVGDGFPVRSLFSHHEHGARVSPFLLFDYSTTRDRLIFHRPPSGAASAPIRIAASRR